MTALGTSKSDVIENKVKDWVAASQKTLLAMTKFYQPHLTLPSHPEE
jgi:hypothetical protein